MKEIKGFSKLSKRQKLNWLVENYPHIDQNRFEKYWYDCEHDQKIFDDLSENTISNFVIPFGLAPNFKIDGKTYTVPMVIEESSVVAAASKSAKMWFGRGGFHTEVLGTEKLGHVHFFCEESGKKLNHAFQSIKDLLLNHVMPYCQNMESRGGGVRSIALIDKTEALKDYFQLELKFETCDAMGANFINTVLEKVGRDFKEIMLEHYQVPLDLNMCILSNYTPNCLVRAFVECSFEQLGSAYPKINPQEFARKFQGAIDIARVDTYRAVTHNKGILNGIDAVTMATGNDFRAVEAACHAYAARDGQYRGLSQCRINEEHFHFELTLPLSLGVVGGLTNLHPLVKESFKLLENPGAKELMRVMAAVGLAQNFAAVSSLVTTGIQKGHMKMHLLNILSQLNATEKQKKEAKEYFKNKTISYSEVQSFLDC